MSKKYRHRLQNMVGIEQIRACISEDVFDYTQLMEALSSYQKPRDVVTSLLKKEQIIRIRKGLYIFNSLWRKKPIPYNYLANIIYGPSVVSLDLALSWYGLIPEMVKQITSVTVNRSRYYNTPLGVYNYKKTPQSLFSVGINLIKNDSHSFFMALPLKALADKVWADKRFKPSSPASYSAYLFDDLRIDEERLLQLYLDHGSVLSIYGLPRKIKWLDLFIKKQLNHRK